MSIKAQIEALENLAALDSQLDAMQLELEQERLELGDRRGQLEALESRLEATRASIVEMERVRSELVHEARQMSLQMDRSREKLSRSRTEREVNAAQREVEELRKLFRDREAEIQKLGNLVDQARQDIARLEEEARELAGELGSGEAAVESHLGQLQQRLEQSRKQRESLTPSVPPVLFRRYEMIRQRRGVAICHTSTGTCSACHIALPPMMFQNLRRSAQFEQCPSCNRILYFKAEAPPEEPEAATDEGESSSE